MRKFLIFFHQDIYQESNVHKLKSFLFHAKNFFIKFLHNNFKFNLFTFSFIILFQQISSSHFLFFQNFISYKNILIFNFCLRILIVYYFFKILELETSPIPQYWERNNASSMRNLPFFRRLLLFESHLLFFIL